MAVSSLPIRTLLTARLTSTPRAPSLAGPSGPPSQWHSTQTHWQLRESTAHPVAPPPPIVIYLVLLSVLYHLHWHIAVFSAIQVPSGAATSLLAAPSRSTRTTAPSSAHSPSQCNLSRPTCRWPCPAAGSESSLPGAGQARPGQAKRNTAKATASPGSLTYPWQTPSRTRRTSNTSTTRNATTISTAAS